MAAAIRGTRRIKNALIFAVLTSVAAFTPLLFIPGGIGEVWSALPVIVISMLLISLAEALLILPKHLSHLQGPEWVPANLVDRFLSHARGAVDRGLNGFVSGPLDRILRFATNWPAVVVAGVVGLFVVSLSLVPAGIVPTTFAPVVEGDFVTANLEMPDGTPAERTYQVAMELERAGRRVLERLDRDRADGTPVEGYLIRTRSGGEVPIGQVASMTMGRSPPSIRRQDGQRVVTVTADVDENVIPGGEANAILNPHQEVNDEHFSAECPAAW